MMDSVSLLRSRVESLLLVSDEPATAEDFARILSSVSDGGTGNESVESNVAVSDAAGKDSTEAYSAGVSVEAVTAVLHEIAEEFDRRGSGFELREVDGAYRLYTRRSNSPTVEAKMMDGVQQRLSKAALETLAVVAYRQPVTRSQVAAIRGVNCDGVMRTLHLRGLIADAGTGDAGANLYTTTELFLEQLGIHSLEELPDLAPLLPGVEAIDDVEGY